MGPKEKQIQIAIVEAVAKHLDLKFDDANAIEDFFSGKGNASKSDYDNVVKALKAACSVAAIVCPIIEKL